MILRGFEPPSLGRQGWPRRADHYSRRLPSNSELNLFHHPLSSGVFAASIQPSSSRSAFRPEPRAPQQPTGRRRTMLPGREQPRLSGRTIRLSVPKSTSPPSASSYVEVGQPVSCGSAAPATRLGSTRRGPGARERFLSTSTSRRKWGKRRPLQKSSGEEATSARGSRA